MNMYFVEESAKYQIAAEPFGGVVPFAPEIVAEVGGSRSKLNTGRAAAIWAYFEHAVLQSGVPV